MNKIEVLLLNYLVSSKSKILNELRFEKLLNEMGIIEGKTVIEKYSDNLNTSSTIYKLNPLP